MESKAQLSYSFIGNDQNFPAVFLLNDFRQGLYAAGDFRRAVGQERQSDF